MSEVAWEKGEDGWEKREYQSSHGLVREARRPFYRSRSTPTTIEKWTDKGYDHVDLTESRPMWRRTTNKGTTALYPYQR